MIGFQTIKDIFSKNQKIDDPIKKELNDQEPEVELVEANKNKFSFFMDDFVSVQSVSELIELYRSSAENSEIENAVDEICSEAIIKENKKIINLNLDTTDFSDNIKKKIFDEFNIIIKLLKFNSRAYDLFKQWYIDGRMYYYLKIDETKLKNGIVSFEILDPAKIKKIRNKETGVLSFIYEKDKDNTYKIDSDLIVFIHSGVTDPQKKYYVSYLHKSLKPLNQLRLLEDSTIIYRVTRAPERRVFYIDVGRLSKKKAEAYVKKMIDRFKNKISYDVNTGKITNQKNVMTMLEDFYFPTTADSKGTKVDTLESGQQLTDMQDIYYFKKKLYKSLKIPMSRVDEDNSPVVDIGRTGELTRDELKFSKFIKRLQNQFGLSIVEILKRQLIWKNIIDKEDWANNNQEIFINWNVDSYFSEIKNQEIFKSRLEILAESQEYVGKYFSNTFINKNILKFSDEEIENMKKEIEEEKQSGEITTDDEME